MFGGARRVNVFHAFLVANLQPMNARWAVGAQELAVRRKNDNAAFGIRSDVDIAGFVDDYAPVTRTELLIARFGVEEIGHDRILWIAWISRMAATRGVYDEGEAQQSRQ